MRRLPRVEQMSFDQFMGVLLFAPMILIVWIVALGFAIVVWQCWKELSND
jgi:hypothetical protein